MVFATTLFAEKWVITNSKSSDSDAYTWRNVFTALNMEINELLLTLHR